VKIDLVAGHGIGAASAALAAIDGGARLWEQNGIWRSAGTRRMYRWKIGLRIAAPLAGALLTVLLLPLLVLILGAVLLPAGFLLQLAGVDAGGAVTAAYSAGLQAAFAEDWLPTLVPRAVTIVLAALALTLAAAGLLHERQAARRGRGRVWWWLRGAPFDASGACESFGGALWQLIRGAAPLGRPSDTALGRRYAEVLAENLGQPGFRELVVVATDLDARRDLVAALLADPFRQDFMGPRPGRDRRAEVLDLSGIGRDHAVDLLLAALTPPHACDPHAVTFTPDSFWRGETHRLCDRAGTIARLLEEVAAAGVTQVIVVSAAAPIAAPHRLRTPRLDVRGRLGELHAAAEAASLRDALEIARLRFDAVFTVAPAHNAIDPFDFDGAWDEASARRQTIAELMELAYEDAHRQFIDPVVGASGDQLSMGSGVITRS
jgi:hypothetical protein